MNKGRFLPRRFIVNFVNGDCEFNDDDTPPAEEYLSLIEHETALKEVQAKNDNLKQALAYYADKENHYYHAYDCDVSIAQKALDEK